MYAGETLTPTSSRDDLEARLRLYDERIRNALRPYEPLSAYACLMDGIRTAEEVINLPFADWRDKGFRDVFFTRPVHVYAANPDKLATLHHHLTRQFTEYFANRMASLIQQATAMGMSFRQHGFPDVAAGLYTIANMMDYFQSRRRHLLGLLHFIPSVCTGKSRLNLWDALAVFLPIVEFEGIQLMGAQNCLIKKLSCERLGLREVPREGPDMLDDLYLEPERARVIDMPWTDTAYSLLQSHEVLRKDRLFSAAEVRNDITTIRAAYSEFDLTAANFESAAQLVEHISRAFVDRDFWIVISPLQLRRLFSDFNTPTNLQAALINKPTSYYDCLASYAPFTLIDGQYRSTATLLSRFIYYWRGQVLDRGKRFQIRAGFIFEKAVAEVLEHHGFTVQDITRVRRAEFDVVTVRDGVIWNVQCKNNFIDLERVQANPERYAHYNRKYVRSYEHALAKELGREHLLKGRLGLTDVQHVVVSKFPVITDNSRILSFNQLRHLGALADGLKK